MQWCFIFSWLLVVVTLFSSEETEIDAGESVRDIRWTDSNGSLAVWISEPCSSPDSEAVLGLTLLCDSKMFLGTSSRSIPEVHIDQKYQWQSRWHFLKLDKIWKEKKTPYPGTKTAQFINSMFVGKTRTCSDFQCLLRWKALKDI